MISLERLAERGLLDLQAVAAIPDGESSGRLRQRARAQASAVASGGGKFLRSAAGPSRERYERFCRDNQWWLEDYVLFSILREQLRPAALERLAALKLPGAILTTIAQLHSELHDQRLDEERFLQFAFFEQWRALRSYCAERGIRVIGDVSIFVSYDSADVWTHPEMFRLKEDLSPEVVAGVPPDAFSETGQRWGNPLV